MRRKNPIKFGFSFDLHYLCSRNKQNKNYGYSIYIRKCNTHAPKCRLEFSPYPIEKDGMDL